jgi:hypothetical protein
MATRQQRAQRASAPALKLTIAIAAAGDVKSDFALSLAAQVKSLTCPIRLDVEKSCYVHHNRNKLLYRALDSDSTHLLFVDSDMAWPIDGAQRLLAHGLDIVGADYNRRQTPPISVSKPLGLVEGATMAEPRYQQLFEAEHVGTGFMLIRLDAVRDLPRPYFDFPDYDRAVDAEYPFIGEDVAFCLKARQHGVRVWCDPTLNMGHIGETVF